MFSWFAIIQTVNRRSPHTTCIIHSMLTSVLLVEGLSRLRSFFASSHASLNLLHHSKTARYCVISIHLLKHFKCLWRSFRQQDQRFQVYSLLGVHRSFFRIHSRKIGRKRALQTKAWAKKKKKKKKKLNGCTKLKLKIYHHHHVVPSAQISLTLSRHFFLSFIAYGRSSGLHPVSSHSCCM